MVIETTPADGERSPPPSASEPDPIQATLAEMIARLRKVAEEPDARLTCNGLIERIGIHSHALALLVFALLNLLPAPPGYNFIVSLVILAFAILMLFHRPIYLWRWVGERRLPLKPLMKLMDILARIADALTRISSPRLLALSSRPMLPLLGLFNIIMALTMLPPIPFCNMLPSLAVAMISAGILNRDGWLILGGILIGVLGVIALVIAVLAIIALLWAIDTVV